MTKALGRLAGVANLATTKDQGLRLLTAGVAGPALIWAGYKYPGTTQSKLALAALGAALIYANYSAFQEAMKPSNDDGTA